MIYLDTSVVLAELFAEDQRAPAGLWQQPLVASRLLEYEVWVRVNARRAARTHGEAVRAILTRTSFVSLLPPVLARATEPFPVPVRTLDALHLATAVYLKEAHAAAPLATFDLRMRAAAAALGLPLAPGFDG